MPSALVALSGVSARVTLGRDAMPHNIFLIGAHEYPLGDLSHRATAAPANIIEGGGAHRHTGCIRTFRDRLHIALRHSVQHSLIGHQTMRCAGSSRQASGLASSCAASLALPTFISSGKATLFFTAVISARMEMAISDGVLLPI